MLRTIFGESSAIAAVSRSSGATPRAEQCPIRCDNALFDDSLPVKRLGQRGQDRRTCSGILSPAAAEITTLRPPGRLIRTGMEALNLAPCRGGAANLVGAHLTALRFIV